MSFVLRCEKRVGDECSPKILKVEIKDFTAVPVRCLTCDFVPLNL